MCSRTSVIQNIFYTFYTFVIMFYLFALWNYNLSMYLYLQRVSLQPVNGGSAFFSLSVNWWSINLKALTSVKLVLPPAKHTWPLQVVQAVTRCVFKATHILWHHSISFLLLIVFFRKEIGSQIRAQSTGHEIHWRDGGVGHIWTALHMPN